MWIIYFDTDAEGAKQRQQRIGQIPEANQAHFGIEEAPGGWRRLN